MFNRIKLIINHIKNLNLSIDNYKKSTIIQSLPSVALVNKAKKLLETDKVEEAEITLNEALALTEKDPLVYKYLGMVYDRKKESEKAVEAYKKSAQLCYTDKNIWQRLGFAQLACGEYEDAEKSFENSNRIAPANSDTQTGWGMSFMKQKKYDIAREKFVSASRINKYNFTAIFLAAVCEIKLGEYKDADAKLSFLANVCPSETNTYEYANLKFIKKDYKNAKHYAQKSIDINSNMLPAYLLLGKIYTIELEKERALSYFQDAENKDLKNSTLYGEWGISLFNFSDFQSAEEKFVKALCFDGENTDFHAYLALTRLMQGNNDEALINIIKNKDAKHKILELISAIKKYNFADFKSALSDFRNITDSEHEFIVTYYLAKINQALKNQEKTKDFYEKTLTLNPYFLKNAIEYVNYLIESNDFTEAQRKLRKVIKFNPNNTKVLNLQFFASYILVKENLCEYNIKESLSIAEKIIAINPAEFKYYSEKSELEKILNSVKEK